MSLQHTLETAATALLALSDESVFYGFSKGYNDITRDKDKNGDGLYCVGEVVFNTAMTGYQEILTDPSYHSQIIVFTQPHIGNVGATSLDEEADKIFSRGMVARKISDHYSNWRATQSLPTYLKQRQMIAIDGIDTRKLTRHLRQQGALNGCIMVLPPPVAADETQRADAAKKAIAYAQEFSGLGGAMLAENASTTQSFEWDTCEWQQSGDKYKAAGEAQRRVTILDCGVKKNILCALTERGCHVTVLPYTANYQMLKASNPDGVLISNGPGDPEPCENARTLVRQLMNDNIPLFGLCLGHQIVASALGAKTEKMKFGHHGANHPVQEQKSGHVFITSQNHGFAVQTDSLPPQVRVTYRSLFDGTLQGIAADHPPLITFQGHPEASPGPKDAAVLFNQFVGLIDQHKQAHAQA